jgi:hypothetical protein
MSKYQTLSQFLLAGSVATRRMSFAQIERVLGFKLPKSAYTHEAWWSNNATGHSHAQTWLSAGWRTEDVDLRHQKVTFRLTSKPSEQRKRDPKPDPWGCMSGTVTFIPGVDLTAPADENWNAEAGRLLNE